jgi:hypothetical protein
MKNSDMVNKKSWDEFQNSGLLWWINRLLHTFGWAIVLDIDEEHNIINVYPARVKFRGFCRSIEEEGFQRISLYMSENSKNLLEESKE